MNKESMDYENIKHKEPIVYVIQELPGTSMGRPKFNIMGALKYGKLKVLLKENAQIVLSPGPVIFELRRLLKNYTSKDYLLLSGDPAIIGLACTIVSDINGGRFNLLKWDRQEKVYYPLEINPIILVGRYMIIKINPKKGLSLLSALLALLEIDLCLSTSKKFSIQSCVDLSLSFNLWYLLFIFYKFPQPIKFLPVFSL